MRSLLSRILILAAASIFAGAAAAAVYDASVAVTAPTTRVGGAPLTAAEIAGYRVYFNCSATPQQQGGTISGSPPLIIPSLFPADGTYSVCTTAVDTGGRVSEFSNAINVTVSQIAKPNPGTLTGITVSCPGGTPVRVVSSTPTALVVECDAP